MPVLEAAALLAVLLDDDDAAPVGDVLRAHAGEGFLVPAGWRHELANGLRAALAGRRRTRAQVLDLARYADALPVTVSSDATETVEAILRESLDLSAYDAAYLRLAAASGRPLVTLDATLRRVCQRLGIEVLPA